MRSWRNWQTRKTKDLVVHTMQVQFLSTAPEKKSAFGTLFSFLSLHEFKVFFALAYFSRLAALGRNLRTFKNFFSTSPSAFLRRKAHSKRLLAAQNYADHIAGALCQTKQRRSMLYILTRKHKKRTRYPVFSFFNLADRQTTVFAILNSCRGYTRRWPLPPSFPHPWRG